MKSLMIPQALREAYPPLRDALLEEFCQLININDLREISQADYGEAASEHFQALLPIWQKREITAPMLWEPKEVLCLTRWSEPDKLQGSEEIKGKRGHRIRGFATAVLLLASFDPRNQEYGEFDGENQTLIQLIDSALALDSELLPKLGSFLTWRIPSLDLEDERVFFVLGLVLIAVLDRTHSFSNSVMVEVAHWLIAEEEQCRSYLESQDWLPQESEQWLLGLTDYDLRHHKWKLWAERACTKIKCAELRQVFQRIFD